MTDLPSGWIIPIHHTYTYFQGPTFVPPTSTTYTVWNPVISDFQAVSFQSNNLYYANGAGVFLYQDDHVSFDPIQYTPGYTLPAPSSVLANIAGAQITEITSSYSEIDGGMPGEYLARLQDFYNGKGPDPALTPPPKPFDPTKLGTPALIMDEVGICCSLIVPLPAPLLVRIAALLGEAVAFLTFFNDVRLAQDPFDPNWQVVYTPTFQILPTVPSDPTLPGALADEANTALDHDSKASSYLQAIYVSLNRYDSAQ